MKKSGIYNDNAPSLADIDHILTLLLNSRLIRPKLSQLEIHEAINRHNEGFEYIDSIIPLHQPPSAITQNNLIRLNLLINPIVVTRDKNSFRHWKVISNITKYHIAKLYLPPNNTINAFVVEEPSSHQIDQIIVHDQIINSILEIPSIKVKRIWAIKQHLENNGKLALMGLNDISNAKWAKWLNCDVRCLNEK